MGLINNFKRWIGMLFAAKAENEFDVKNITSKTLEQFIARCESIYKGNPEWAIGNVKTVNFARSICQETARLTTLAISVNVDGESQRAEWIQKQLDDVYYKLRSWVEYANAYGAIILKPNGQSIDVVLPDKFMVTNRSGSRITGGVFVNQERSNDGKTYYTRLEYHRFLDDANHTYMITNKCYKGSTKNDVNTPCNIEDTPFKGLREEIGVANLEKPLFAVLTTAGANPVDIDSPMGLPIFADAIEELKDLDVAYSRNAEEIFDSERVVLLDADKLLPTKGTANNAAVQKNVRENMELPKFVRNVMGNGSSDFYQEINPLLQTGIRLEGINALLSQIGYKCGFSNGYFVFNEKTGMVTATQIESEDRRTIQLIKDMRDQLECCLEDLCYALDKFADLYGYAPAGTYELKCGFGDITYSYEEDKHTWWNYVVQGKVSFWRYLVKFENMTEEEAKKIAEEAVTNAAGMQALFQAE